MLILLLAKKQITNNLKVHQIAIAKKFISMVCHEFLPIEGPVLEYIPIQAPGFHNIIYFLIYTILHEWPTNNIVPGSSSKRPALKY